MSIARIPLAMVAVTLCAMMITSARADKAGTPGLRVGWATTDITPDKPVVIVGFHAKRISRGVRDPLTATVLALESVGPTGDVAEQAITVSCDLILIRKSTQESVKRILAERLPDFDSDKLLLNATHTHQGPMQQSGTFKAAFDLTPKERAQGVMTGDEYGKLLAERVAEAAVKAWKSRKAARAWRCRRWANTPISIGPSRRRATPR